MALLARRDFCSIELARELAAQGFEPDAVQRGARGADASGATWTMSAMHGSSWLLTPSAARGRCASGATWRSSGLPAALIEAATGSRTATGRQLAREVRDRAASARSRRAAGRTRRGKRVFAVSGLFQR